MAEPAQFKYARVPAPRRNPRYYAFETQERGVYRCPAWGAQLASRAQLETWAAAVGVELRYVTQPARGAGNG